MNKNKQLELFLTLEGFEGPIDLLLQLAKDQKVDLSCISIVELANQYISFINKVSDIEIAADYLIMATWLVYLKSKLLIPNFQNEMEENIDIISEELKDSIRKLEAMQNAGKKLLKLPKLGSERFSRGLNEKIYENIIYDYNVNLFDLLKVYSKIKNSSKTNELVIKYSKFLSISDAIENIKNLNVKLNEWVSFFQICNLEKIENKSLTKNHIASHFAASLELVKKGEMKIFQNLQFDTLWIKNVNE